MLRTSNIILFTKQFKSFKIKLRKNYTVNAFNPTRSDNYLNTIKFNKFISVQTSGITRFQHGLQSEQEDDLDKFSKILKKIEENENNLSVGFITAAVEKMHEILNEIALESQHEKELLNSKSFRKLTKAVTKLIHEIEANDLVRFLDLCYKLHMVHVINEPIKALRKVRENAESLSLESKIKFFKLLSDDLMAIDKQLVSRLRGDFAMRVEQVIKSREYANCLEDTIAALHSLTLLKKLPISYKIHVLYAVLDLKKWDDGMIFKLFLKTELPADHPLTMDIKERFGERINREIDSNNKFLSDFLVSFSKNKNNFFGYDKDLVDAVVHKIIENNLNTQQIRKVCTSLEHLDHVNYKLIEYLAEFLKKNPGIYKTHPTVSAQIIEIMAKSNCNYKDRNRWGNITSVVKNSDLPLVVKNQRPKWDIQYFYLLNTLASLEIFIDDELIYISEDIHRRRDTKNNYLNSYKHLALIANLHSAVKVLYPSYEGSILTEDDLTVVIDNFSAVYKSSRNSLIRLDCLMEIGKCLESTSGVNNCLLLNCMTKFGFVFDGLIAVNKEGRLFKFNVGFNQNEKIFLEDIDLPEDYKLIALQLVAETEHSRNTWDLKPPSALRVKITEKLGYRTHIIYDSWWKSLKSDEKGKYLNMLQGYG